MPIWVLECHCPLDSLTTVFHCLLAYFILLGNSEPVSYPLVVRISWAPGHHAWPSQTVLSSHLGPVSAQRVDFVSGPIAVTSHLTVLLCVNSCTTPISLRWENTHLGPVLAHWSYFITMWIYYWHRDRLIFIKQLIKKVHFVLFHHQLYFPWALCVGSEFQYLPFFSKVHVTPFGWGGQGLVLFLEWKMIQKDFHHSFKTELSIFLNIISVCLVTKQSFFKFKLIVLYFSCLSCCVSQRIDIPITGKFSGKMQQSSLCPITMPPSTPGSPDNVLERDLEYQPTDCCIFLYGNTSFPNFEDYIHGNYLGCIY